MKCSCPQCRRERESWRDLWVIFFFVLASAAIVLFAGCTMVPDPGKSRADYPDASTPAGLRVPGTLPGQDEFNGGLVDDITLNDRAYSVVTARVAAKIEAWQGSRQGFVKIDYKDHASYFPALEGVPAGYYELWAIDKGVISAWIHAGN